MVALSQSRLDGMVLGHKQCLFSRQKVVIYTRLNELKRWQRLPVSPQSYSQHIGKELFMKKNTEKTIFIILLILAIAVIMACVIVTVVPPKRSSKAERVDLSCITEPKANPLQECKE